MIYIDVHGVLADYVSGFLNYHEKENIAWPKGEYDIEKVTGNKWDDVDVTFWYNLAKTAECDRFLELTQRYNVTLITRTYSAVQTMETAGWVYRHIHNIPILFVDRPKAQCVLDTSRHVLIDDQDEELARWNGPSLLVPRPWNKGTQSMETFFNNLEGILRKFQ